MNKLTKIIATIGPACDSPGMIESLIKKGVNVFRFNFKHNTVEWHSDRIQRVNKVAKKMGVHVGTLIDLQGPELRINMPTDEITLKENELILFGEEIYKNPPADGRKGISITHPDIIQYLKDGQHIVADDGAFSFRIEKKGKTTYLRSLTTGVLKTRKTLNIPGADFPFPVLIERDFDGLKLAALHDVDFVALSFVRTQSDVSTVRKEMKKYKVNGKIVSKIETQKALDHLDKIIEASDGIMVARGDLGVEIPIEQVPFYQKMMIRKCIIQGKFVITATQMLQSMIEFPYPTRAEVSDIANAIYDNTDCIMLSGETANGKYPLEAVEMQAKTAMFYETKATDDIRIKILFSINDSTAMIADTAYELYRQFGKAIQKVDGFLVFTQTGRTAEALSRYRPKVPIFTCAPNEEVAESLAVRFGVEPFVFDFHKTQEVNITEILKAKKMLRDKKFISISSKLIVVHGDHWGRGSGASTLRII